jgi:UDP-N-acetylmuramoyl-L-alanyl-D-glutamate--2,6-diaminopimelate ligase
MLLPNIYPVTCHTDHVGPGSTFVAIKGYKDDGGKYITIALEKGATTIIVTTGTDTQEIKDLCKHHHANLVTVPDTRQALATYTSKALDYPWKKLKIIGITGTKGKTTTTYLTEYLLRQAGHKTALLSTIENRILNNKEDSVNTTPEGDYLQMFFAECVKQGVEFVVMEVSSHALSLNRVYGTLFDGIGFTNLAPEHMDFYSTLEDYFAAKAQLFAHSKNNGTIVINTDDEWGRKALTHAHKAAPTNATFIDFGQNQATTPFTITQNAVNGIAINIKNTTISCPSLFGEFNGYNLAMATLLCHSQGLNMQHIAYAATQFPGVPGRLQRHTLKNGAHAFVDYAHNPSSFEAILNTLRPYTHHLIVVFGCGGNRDKTKRPVMGKLAATIADTVVITNDNPRFENPDDIMKEILAGIPQEQSSKIICHPDRHQAIATAAAMSCDGSIIALLGKGHEAYYLVQGQKLHFDDLEEIRNF